MNVVTPRSADPTRHGAGLALRDAVPALRTVVARSPRTVVATVMLTMTVMPTRIALPVPMTVALKLRVAGVKSQSAMKLHVAWVNRTSDARALALLHATRRTRGKPLYLMVQVKALPARVQPPAMMAEALVQAATKARALEAKRRAFLKSAGPGHLAGMCLRMMTQVMNLGFPGVVRRDLRRDLSRIFSLFVHRRSRKKWKRWPWSSRRWTRLALE